MVCLGSERPYGILYLEKYTLKNPSAEHKKIFWRTLGPNIIETHWRLLYWSQINDISQDIFLFHRRKKCIHVWNTCCGVNAKIIFIFRVNYPFNTKVFVLFFMIFHHLMKNLLQYKKIQLDNMHQTWKMLWIFTCQDSFFLERAFLHCEG